MKRYLKVGIYNVAELSTMKTLKEILSDKNAPQFWDPKTLRAETRLKKIIKGVTTELLRQHRLGKTHGGLSLENIIFLHDDLDNPIIVNWQDGGSKEGDFKALRKILRDISQMTGRLPTDWDIELEAFYNLLKNTKRDLVYLQNHFWFHEAVDRFRFFTERVPSAFAFLSSVDAKLYPSILQIPRGITQHKLPPKSNLLKALIASNKNGVRSHNKFRDTVQFLRNYYSHGVVKGFTCRLQGGSSVSCNGL